MPHAASGKAATGSVVLRLRLVRMSPYSIRQRGGNVLIRLAEIRAEAAQEEYDLAHPREAALRKRLRWLRIKAQLLALWAAAAPAAVWCRRRAALRHAWLRAQYNVLALAFTRRLGVPPPRAVAEQLPVKGLLLEL